MKSDLELPLEFVEDFIDFLCFALHVLSAKRHKLIALPFVPVGIPLLRDLPHLLQEVHILRHRVQISNSFLLEMISIDMSDLLQSLDGFGRFLLDLEEAQAFQNKALLLF